MDDAFVDVYSKATGKKRRVPAHYLANPRLMAPFQKTPKQRAADAARGAGSDTPSSTDAVAETPSENPTSTADTPSAAETPAAGAKE